MSICCSLGSLPCTGADSGLQVPGDVVCTQCLLPAPDAKGLNLNRGNAGLGVVAAGAEGTREGPCLQGGAAAGGRAISSTLGMVSSTFTHKQLRSFQLPHSCPAQQL